MGIKFYLSQYFGQVLQYRLIFCLIFNIISPRVCKSRSNCCGKFVFLFGEYYEKVSIIGSFVVGR